MRVKRDTRVSELAKSGISASLGAKTLMMGQRGQPSGEIALDVLASIAEAAQTAQVGVESDPHEIRRKEFNART